MGLEQTSTQLPGQGAIWTPPEVLQELAGEGDLIAELIETYTVDVAQRVERLHAALQRCDAAAVRSQVHAIKGSSKQMAAFQVASLCEQVETSVDASIDELGALVALLERSVSEVCEAMAWYQRLATQRAS